VASNARGSDVGSIQLNGQLLRLLISHRGYHFNRAGFLLFVLVFVSQDLELGGVPE